MTTTNGTTSTRSARSTRSRTATASAFDDAKTRAARDGDVDPKTKEALKARRAKVKKDVAEMSIEKATSAVAAAKVKITQTLDSLNDEINGKLDELRLVNEAIALAQAELQQLHDNDAVLSNTADLVEQHEQRKRDLEEEMRTLQATWQKNQAEHDAAVLERDRELDKVRKREADDYNFNIGQKRRNEDFQFAEQVRVRKLQEVARQEAFEKNLAEREAAMAARETELATYKQKADGFEAAVDAAKSEAITATTKALAKENAAGLDKVRMERETDKRVFELETANLRNSRAERDVQIARLQSELETARKGVSELATAAMESASGKKALEAVSQMQTASGQKK